MSSFSKVLCSFLMISGSLFASSERVVTSEEEFLQLRAKRVEEESSEYSESSESSESSDSYESSSYDRSYGVQAKKAAVYISSHSGAYHHPVDVSFLGDTVDFEDGSRWIVNPDDRFLTFKWFTGDTLIVVPNHALFSSYNFKIVNLNTNDVIRVNLVFKPIKNSIYTYWIAAIDRVNDVVLLNDGTLWTIWWNDAYWLSRNWLDYDTVIIGINDDLISGSYGNFLFNVDANNTVRAQCQF